MQQTPPLSLNLKKCRFPDAAQMRAVFSERARRWEPKANTALNLLKQINCEPPHDQEELDREGLGWTTNADFGAGEEFFHEHIQPRHDFLHEGAYYVSCQTIYGEPVEGERCMSLFAEYHRALFGASQTISDKGIVGWSDWHSQLWSLLANSTTYSVGIAWWPDCHGKIDGGWRFQSVPYMDFLPPPRAKLDPDGWDLFFIRGKTGIAELLPVLRDKEAAQAAGWDVEAVRNVVWSVVHSGLAQLGGPYSGYSYQDPWENIVFENDIFFSVGERYQAVYMVTGYVREYGKGLNGWRKHIFVLRDAGSIQAGATSAEFYYANEPTKQIGYLYVAPDNQLYEKASDIICLCAENYGMDGYLDEIRSPMLRMFPATQALNDMRCRMIDNVLMGSSINLQPQTASDLKKLQTLRFQMGGINVLPPGFNMLQSPVPASTANGLVAMTQEFDRMRQQKKAVFDPRDAGAQADTVYGAKMQVAQATEMSQFATNRDANFATRLHATMIRRMLDKDFLRSDPSREEVIAVKRMLKLLEMQGCTREYLDGIIRINFEKQIGNGNAALALQHIAGLEPMRPRMTPIAQHVFDNMAVTAMAGPHIARKLVPLQPVLGDIEFDVADGENRDIEQGVVVSAKPWHSPAKHMAVHTPAATRLVQQWAQFEQQSANNPDDLPTLQRFNTVFNAYLTHVIGDGMQQPDAAAQPHLLAMADQNSPEYAQYAETWNAIANVAKRVSQMTATAEAAEQQRQAEMAAQPPPMSPVEQAKLLTEQMRQQQMSEKAILEATLKQRAADLNEAITTRKAATAEAVETERMAREDGRKSASHQIAQALAQVDLATRAGRGQAEVTGMQQKTQAEIAAMQQKTQAETEAIRKKAAAEAAAKRAKALQPKP